MKVFSLCMIIGAVLCAEVNEKNILTLMSEKIFSKPTVGIAELSDFVDGKSTKTITMQIKSQNENTLISLLDPARDKGKYILKNGRQLWIYFAELKRAMRIALRDSFQGSEASHYDLMVVDLTADYTVEAMSNQQINGIDYYELFLAAKPNVEGYSKITALAAKDTLFIYKNFYYSASGKCLKSVRYDKYEKIDNQYRPLYIEIQNEIDKSAKTIITFRSLKYDPGIKPNIFSLGYLKGIE